MTVQPPHVPAGGPTPDPSDNTTMTQVLAEYRTAGFVIDFAAEEQGVRCSNCCSVLEPRRLSIRSLRRLEGASDPADMAAVVATTCPVCGADGTMVLGYGSAAAPEDADVLRQMEDRRDDDPLPPSGTPAEMPQAQND